MYTLLVEISGEIRRARETIAAIAESNRIGGKGIVTGIEASQCPPTVPISITGFYFHFLAGSRLRSQSRRKIETETETERAKCTRKKNGEFMRRQESKEMEEKLVVDPRDTPTREWERGALPLNIAAVTFNGKPDIMRSNAFSFARQEEDS